MWWTRTLRAAVLVPGAVGLLSVPTQGQEPGTIDLGLFARWSWWDPSLRIEHDFFNAALPIGGGARLGVFVANNLELEVTGSYTDTRLAKRDDRRTLLQTDVNYIPVRGRLTYNAPVSEKFAILIGAGGVHNEYSAGIDGSDNGATGLFGFRIHLGDVASLRIEGTGDYIPSPVVPANDNWNWGVQAGFGFSLPGRARDTDGDGVRDRDDTCPGTAMGEIVDANGCPVDSDNDGVTDFRDRCPNSAAGEIVDAEGCPRDSDGDGVTDANDRCANTPRGQEVNATGCPLDSDGDRVPDPLDRCPNTPAGANVDENGCPVDNDGDGVADFQDRCPNTPIGASVDATGCPTDADGDNVPDGLDRCPNTAAGTEVDAVGCPILFEEETVEVVLTGVNFELNSAELTTNAQTILNDVAQSLIANRGFRVEVGGHTDATGSRDYNLQLSERRANAVRNYLIGQGVEAARLESRGYGPDQPVATNSTREGRAQNRRVALRRLDQ